VPDFTSYLRPPAASVGRPPVLPAELYSGIIKNWEVGDNNQNKTPYVRYHIGLVDWPESVPESARTTVGPDHQIYLIDLSKRQFRRDFFLTPDAYYRLTEFLQSCGIEVPLENGVADFESSAPQAVGCRIKVEIQVYTNQRTGEPGNQIGMIFGDQQ
jgi:hypothetical protein